MNKMYKNIPIIALLFTPLILYQWNMKFVWLKIDTNTEIYSYIYLLSSIYILAYLLIYKNYKIGYYTMWLTSILLFSFQFRLLGFNLTDIIISFDLWLNIIITIFGILKVKQRDILN